MAPTRFYCVGDDVNLQFNTDARGKVNGLRVEHPDHDEDTAGRSNRAALHFRVNTACSVIARIVKKIPDVLSVTDIT